MTPEARPVGGRHRDDQGPERPDPLVGQELGGRYRLTRRIGEGGMGTVYEAAHTLIDKPVAVKVLREKYVDRPSLAQRLVQEANLASSIRHDHIIDITDTGTTEDGRTYVVMELLDGESLAECLRREGALPEARAIEIVRQVADALGAAHRHSVVHRDVKPENVFLVRKDGEEDFVKVLDFGISTVVRDSRDAQPDPNRLTSTGMVLGTPFYMSPEQARGDEEIDHRVDVYALGVILYECLTGEVPFRGPNYLGIISRVLNQEAVPPRTLRPELRISEPIERVVMKAMAKTRDDRYETMDDFVADLERVLAGEGVDAPRPLPQARGEGLQAWMIAAVVMLLVGGAALYWASRPRPPAPAPAPPKQASPPPALPEAPPKTVVVHVETQPPGAEVRQGDRVFGVAPRDVLLPRSEVPTELTFHLDGYEPGEAQVVPLTDDSIRVRLTPKRPKAVARPTRGKGGDDDAPATPARKQAGETLPNPY